MGNDGNEYSEGYCENMQNISVKIKNNDLEFDNLYIIGNNEWHNNNISVIALSDFELAFLRLTIRSFPWKILSPRIRHTLLPPINVSPMRNACANPSGLGCCA